MRFFAIQRLPLGNPPSALHALSNPYTWPGWICGVPCSIHQHLSSIILSASSESIPWLFRSSEGSALKHAWLLTGDAKNQKARELTFPSVTLFLTRASTLTLLPNPVVSNMNLEIFCICSRRDLFDLLFFLYQPSLPERHGVAARKACRQSSASARSATAQNTIPRYHSYITLHTRLFMGST